MIETLESVVKIVAPPKGGLSTYSHMHAVRDHLANWMKDPVYKEFVKQERLLEFARQLPKATAAWVARIKFLRAVNPIYLESVMKWARGSVFFESAMARIAAEEAAVTRAATHIAVASKGTLVAGTGTVIVCVVVPVVAMAAVQAALGAGYHQARVDAKKEEFASGFAKGFICGLLRWEMRFVIDRLWDNAVTSSGFDAAMPAIRAAAHNEGLVKGRVAGLAKTDHEKSDYLAGLRLLTKTSKEGWSARSGDGTEQMRARQVQISYVIELAAAARKHKIVAQG